MNIRYSGRQGQKYAQFAEKLFSWKYLEKPVIESHLKTLVVSHKRVLDAGCGTGRSTSLLLNLGFTKEHIVATDISSNMLEIAQSSLPRVKFIESDLLKLDFNDNSFDIILSNMVLHYLNQDDSRMIIKKFYNWLDHGGYLLFIVVHPFRFPANYSQYFDNEAKVEKTPWGTTMEYYPKKISDYVNAVIESGFELLKVDEPQALVEGKVESSEEYTKYSSIPTRLVIKAKKN